MRKCGIALLAAALLAGCGGDEQPVYLGLAGPMELSYGQALRQAAEMAVDEINRAGGVDGRRLALVVKDDGADPQRAIEVASELKADPRVVAVIGHITSGATLAAAEVYEAGDDGGLLQLSPSASSPTVSDAGDWTFRVCPSDLQHGPALARWAHQQLDSRRVAIVYANDDYGRGVLRSFGSAFEQAGGSVIARDPYLPALIESETALDPYLRLANRRGMDALVIAGLLEEARTILDAARRLGYEGPVLGPDGLIGIESAGETAQEVYVSSPFLPDRSTPQAREFVDAFRQRYGRAPDAFAALSYDATRLVADALETVLPRQRRNTEPTLGDAQRLREALRDHIATVGRSSPAFQGATGAIAFDENGDPVDKEIVVGVVRDGRLVTAGS